MGDTAQFWAAASKQAGMPLAAANGGGEDAGDLRRDAAGNMVDPHTGRIVQPARAQGAGDFWSQAQQKVQQPNAGKPGFWSGFSSLFGPTALYKQAKDVAQSESKLAHEAPGQQRNEDVEKQNFGLITSLAGPEAMLWPTLEEDKEARQSGQDPFALHRQHMKEAAKNMSGAQMAGYGAGLAADALLPKFLPEVASEEEMPGKSLAQRTSAPPVVRGVRNFVRAAKTTPEDVGEKAAGRLIASATQRQNAIKNALTTAKKNVAPLYDNLHAQDEAANPEGAIDLSHVEGVEERPKAKAPRLTIGEARDLEARTTAGSNAPTRRQAAAAVASRLLANGASEGDVKALLRDQFAFNANQTAAVMADATAPGEGGGYTMAQARAIRGQIRRAAGRALRAGDHKTAARLSQSYSDITDAMRERAAQLDPSGGLLRDFDRADKKWSDIRSAEQTLGDLLEAKSGKNASPEDFQKAWDKLDSNQRRELQLLARDAGLDLNALKSGGKTAGKVLRGTRPVQASWMDRYIKGQLPLRLGSAGALGALAYGAHKKALPEWEREALYALPMVGYVGAGMAAPVSARMAALSAIGDLPEELPRAGFGVEMPSARTATPEADLLERGQIAKLEGQAQRARDFLASGSRKVNDPIERRWAERMIEYAREQIERIKNLSKNKAPARGIRSVGGRIMSPEGEILDNIAAPAEAVGEGPRGTARQAGHPRLTAGRQRGNPNVIDVEGRVITPEAPAGSVRGALKAGPSAYQRARRPLLPPVGETSPTRKLDRTIEATGNVRRALPPALPEARTPDTGIRTVRGARMAPEGRTLPGQRALPPAIGENGRVNVLPSSGETIVPGARRALPAGMEPEERALRLTPASERQIAELEGQAQRARDFLASGSRKVNDPIERRWAERTIEYAREQIERIKNLSENKAPARGIRSVGGRIMSPEGEILDNIAAPAEAVEGPRKEAGSVAAKSGEAERAPSTAQSSAEAALLKKLEELKQERLVTTSKERLAGLAKRRMLIEKRLEQVRKTYKKANGGPVAAKSGEGVDQSVFEKYSPEVLEDARKELDSLLRAWEEMPRPGRQHIMHDINGNELSVDHDREWTYTTSARGMLEGMFPWLSKSKGTMSDLREALDKGTGASYERWMEDAADYIEKHPGRWRERGGREPGEEGPDEVPF